MSSIFLLAFLFFNHQKTGKKDCIFLSLIFCYAWLIMSLRDLAVGVDTISYYQMYKAYAFVPFSKLFTTIEIEPGWAILAWTINQLDGNFVWFQIVFYAIWCILSANFIYLTNNSLARNSTFVITVVFFSSIWLLSFNIARQMMAVMFAANAFIYYSKSNYCKSFLLILLAISFHYSAIITIIMFILWHCRENKYIGLLVLLGLILSYFQFELITNTILDSDIGVYDRYLNNSFNNFQEAGFSKIVWLIIVLHSLWVLINDKIFKSYDRIVAIFCSIYVFANILSSQLNYFERVGLYFIPFTPLIYAIVGNSIKSKNFRFVYFSGIVSLYAVWFILASHAPQYIYALNSKL